MVQADASEERKARQRESARAFRFTPEIDDMLTKHAEDNNMSVSEVVREAIHVAMTGEIPPLRRRRTRRRTLWIDPEEYVKFQRKADAAGLSDTDALEAALREIL